MEKIPTLLKQARERKALSLQEVAHAAHIPLQCLEMLEGERDSLVFGDQMYLIPFLRSYATFLGLDPSTAVMQFVTELRRAEVRAADSPRPPQPSTWRSQPFRSWSWTVSLLLFALILAVVWRHGGSELPGQSPGKAGSSPLSPAADSPSLPAETWTQPPAASSVPLRLPTTSDQLTPLAPPARPSPDVSVPEGQSPVVSIPQPGQPSAAAPHVLRAQAKAQTWIRVTIDGHPAKAVLLQPGQTAEWSAREGFTLTLGNAGGVELTLDGQVVPPLGKSGQVIRHVRLPSPRR